MQGPRTAVEATLNPTNQDPGDWLRRCGEGGNGGEGGGCACRYGQPWSVLDCGGPGAASLCGPGGAGVAVATPALISYAVVTIAVPLRLGRTHAVPVGPRWWCWA